MRAAALLLCATLPALSRPASAGENRRLAFAAPALPAAAPADGGWRATGALRFQMTATRPASASPATGKEDDVPVLRLIALKEGASVQNARRDGGRGASSIGRRPDESILRCLATPVTSFAAALGIHSCWLLERVMRHMLTRARALVLC